MKRTKSLKTILAGAAAIAAALAFAGPASALNLNWTGPGGTVSNPTGGMWDTNTPNWDSGAGAVVLTNAVNGVVFGGADAAPGTYGIECTNLTVTNILFSSSGYLLTNLDQPVTVTIGPVNSRGLSVAAGKTATIGTNVTVSASAALNPFYFNQGVNDTGTLIVDNGGTYMHPGNQQDQFDGGPGSTVRILTGGTVQHTGGGSQVRIGLTAGASPTISVEGGRFIITPVNPGFILGAGNNTTGTVAMVSGLVSNTVNNTSITLGNGNPSLGQFDLNGGVLAVRQIVHGSSGAGVLNLNGGTVKGFASLALIPNNAGLTVNVRNNNSTIDSGGFAISISQPLRHSTVAGDNATDGGMTFTGTGSTTLAATNTYTGPTVVTNGVLNLGTSGLINSSSQIAVNSGGTLILSNRLFSNSTGSFSLTDGTVQLNINSFPTNIVTGTFATAGSANVINIPVIVGSGSIPQTTPLIQYTSLAPGVVDANNNLTTLSATLPSGFVGYLSNNVARQTIDLVLTTGSLAPQIVINPAPVTRYAGLTAQFSVTALGADAYFWRSNGIVLSDGGNVSGSKTNLLTLNNVSANANYDVVLTNSSGSVTSTLATLTVIVPVNYAATTLSFSPVSYYRFNETDNSQPAYDFVSGKDGIYLANVAHVPGPLPSDGYANFESDNGAFQCVNGFPDAHAVVSNSWSINTNTVTLLGWINPIGGQVADAGVIFNRGGGTCGLNYTATTNGDGNFTLGYTWNNDGNTYGWDSGLVPPLNQWSMVALVVTPTNATIYVGGLNGLISSVHTYAHPVQAFNGPISIGGDSFDLSGRSFTGNIDEVAVFDHALSQSNLLALITAASGVTNFPPVIATQPVSTTVYQHQTVQLTAQAAGSGPLTFQWLRGTDPVYTNVPTGLTVDGSFFSGATSASLIISNVSLNDAADYVLFVTNSAGQVTSSAAVLTVNPNLGPATNITTSVIQGSGSSWDTAGTWSIAGSATDLSAQYYGSTFTILTGGGLRTPDFGSPASPTSAAFPGDVLRVEGNGTYDSSLIAAGAIRIKGGNPATVYFKKLVMAGGQISSILNSGWPAIFTGEINVISNAVIWASDDTSPRSITVQSTLTGNGSIQYHGYISTSTFRTDTSASLNIANANNPYTGTWNVELGTVAGSALNALGTNTITVGAQGALQTTYDIYNTNADLILNGRINLTQNDTFRQVIINGNPLSTGTHLYTELTNSYPANFPAAWTGVVGALTATNVSGSLTVLAGSSIASYPTNITFSVSGGSLSLTWPATHLGWIAQSNSVALANTNDWFDIAGSQSATNLNITIIPGSTNVFYRLRHP
ncbi:MAG TPA: LamG-like jellyroll fold domain-containing protein [Verrucomicrobiae bacterium]